MAITTADQLRTALQNWTNDQSGGVLSTDRQNECITLAEAMFNRVIRTKGMEATMTSTSLTDGAASLPTGFLAFKELRYDGDTEYTLRPRSLEWIRAQGDADTSEAVYYAISSTQVICYPYGGPIKGTYYKALTSLTGLTATGNWLLTSHPDLYLSAALTEAFIYLQDDARAVQWRQRTVSLLDELDKTDQRDDFDGGPIAVRAR
jgi:hypothetical protein